MAKKTTKKINHGKVIGFVSYAIILIVLIGVLVFFGYFTNWFSSDFKTFYLKVNGETVLDDNGSYVIAPTVPLNIETKYVLAIFDKTQTGYSYEIKVNPNIDLDFTIGEKKVSIQSDDIDWRECFDIVEEEKGFTLTLKGWDLLELLQCVYPDSEIALDADVDYTQNLFSLTVYSRDKKDAVTLAICVATVKSIELDQTRIVF